MEIAKREFEGARVLVTGGAGFIGSHLVDALIECGAHVVVLDNLATGSIKNLEHLFDGEQVVEIESRVQSENLPFSETSALAGLTFVLGDMRDLETCRLAMGLGRRDGAGSDSSLLTPHSSPSLVFHQAALGSVPRSMKDPATSIAVNVSGTANVFAAARDAGVRRVVYASSSSVYGDSAAMPKKEGQEGRPLSPYAETKVMNERLATIFGKCFEMEFVGLRYFNVYGPRQSPEGPYAAVVPKFFDACADMKPPVIHGDGGQSRDFGFVRDAVRANLCAAVAPAESCGRAYNVAPGERTTVNDLASAVREAWGEGVDPIHEDPRPGDVRHSLADTSDAESMLGFEASITLQNGLKTTADWHRERRFGVGA